MNKKKVIGLTGLYCAGKNHVALILEKRGLPVLDIDKLGHKVIETEKERIVSRFGADILNEKGSINRKLLGAKVFNKSEELAALESIVHPAVNRETLAWVSGRKEKACIINAALLHRSSAVELLDAVIVVKAPLLIRLRRARKRDHLPWSAVISRFRSQSGFTPKFFTGKTDIYKVGNPSCLSLRGFFGMESESARKNLEECIGKILSVLTI